MAAIKLTLQNRVISLMVISSILFISVFTIIQLNSQVNNINIDTAYQANLAGILVKNNLENTIRQAQPQETASYIQKELTKLKDAEITKDAVVFNREGKIIAGSETGDIGENVSYRDIAKVEELDGLYQENEAIVSEINKAKRRLDMYVSFKPETQDKIAYIAKISFGLGNIQRALTDVYKPVILSIVLIILANIALGYFLSKMVIGPVKVLNDVTKIIASGDLSIRTRIQTEDELQELGETFNYMTEELIKMKERAENANPLTKLPGNIIIHEEIDKRIKNSSKFMVIYCDLDNFKAFNDKYGIAKGDVAIKLTAEVFKEAAKNTGNPDDFVGHEGGDDFILITTPDKAQAVADHITGEFDKRVRSLYSEEDLKQGFIVAHARDGSIKQFPIMTISLAGITNEHRPIASYAEVTNIAAEVKKKAKAIEGSVFVIDKRVD